MNDSPPERRARIAAAFGGARNYEAAAIVQRSSAARLAERIAAHRTDAPGALPRRILELGCGTGFLTRELLATVGAARWTVSDIAPAMVARARAALDLDADYRVLDGEAVDPALGPFDLIASNLAFQWFTDLPGAVGRLMAMLAPGGMLAFTTMAAGSFAEWSAALAVEGLPSGLPAYPDAAALAGLPSTGPAPDVEIVDIPQPQPSARAFLGGLKAIGAGTPAAGYSPLSPAALRRAMARFDDGGRIATYRIGYWIARADPPANQR